MSASIEDILSSTGQEAPQVETPEPTPEVETPEVDTEQAETPEAPETETLKAEPPTDVPTQALLEERTKRQAAEFERDFLQKQLQPKADPAPVAEPEFDWDDPGKFVKAIQQQQAQQIQALEGKFADRLVGISEANARARHTDFDAKLAAFQKAAQTNPTLIAQAKAHLDPGEFIYQAGTASEELGAVGGSLEAYKAKIRAELLAEVEAEAKAKAAAQPNVPESESASRSASPAKGEQVAVHKPLSEILKR